MQNRRLSARVRLLEEAARSKPSAELDRKLARLARIIEAAETRRRRDKAG